MTRISTQAGGTAKDVKVLSDQVLKLGTSTQQGPQRWPSPCTTSSRWAWTTSTR
jgi:hypothetical protein